jgi:hypothetical protein
MDRLLTKAEMESLLPELTKQQWIEHDSATEYWADWLTTNNTDHHPELLGMVSVLAYFDLMPDE